MINITTLSVTKTINKIANTYHETNMMIFVDVIVFIEIWSIELEILFNNLQLTQKLWTRNFLKIASSYIDRKILGQINDVFNDTGTVTFN